MNGEEETAEDWRENVLGTMRQSREAFGEESVHWDTLHEAANGDEATLGLIEEAVKGLEGEGLVRDDGYGLLSPCPGVVLLKDTSTGLTVAWKF